MNFAIPQDVLESLRGYPPWFVATAAGVAIVLAIWIALKLLKWGIWLAVIAVIVVAGIFLLRTFVK
jgi:hypothetical protein